MSGLQNSNSGRTKKQHLVPQFYLRYFTATPSAEPSAQRIWVYDKQRAAIRESPIKDVAQQRCFYDVPANIAQSLNHKHPGMNVDPQLVEHALAKHEAIWRSYFDRIIQDLDSGKCLNQIYKPVLARYVVQQFLRTRVLRDTVEGMLKDLVAALARKQLELHLPADKADAVGFTVSVSDEWMQLAHSRILFDRDILTHLRKLLEKHMWLVGCNESAQPLYTSDSPVVMRGHCPDSGRSLYFQTRGVEVILPITPTYIVVALERKHFGNRLKQMRIRDGGRFGLDLDGVRAYNTLQVESSRLQVFSSKNEFDLARQVCDARPNLANPDRERSQVVSDLPSNVIGVIRK